MTQTIEREKGGAEQKIPFIDKHLLQIAKLPFGVRPIGLDEKGNLVTEQVPAGQADYFIRDANMRGFALRITASKRTYYAIRKLGPKTIRVVCGEFLKTPLKVAQKKATDALAEIAAGIDPNQKVRDQRQTTLDDAERMKLTFGFVVERDKEQREPWDAKGTKRDRRDVITWMTEQLPGMWSKPVHLITEADMKVMMTTLVEKISAATALKCWRYTRAAWGRMPHAEQPGMNPFDEYLKRSKLPVVKARIGYIPTDEAQGIVWLRAIASMRTTPTGRRPWTKRVMADYVILSLMWGARRNETAPLTWDDVSFEHKWVRFVDPKNSKDHYFPLTAGAEVILRNRKKDNATPRGRDVARAKRGEAIEVSPYVFPSERRGFHLTEPQGALDIGNTATKKSARSTGGKEAESKALTIRMHDLRRTFAGDVATDVMTGGDDGKAKGDFKLIKWAMNHSGADDVTINYIMLKPKLESLKPLYEAHERRILTACGLEHLIPEKEVKTDPRAMLNSIKALAEASADPEIQAHAMALLASLANKGASTPSVDAPSAAV